MGWTDGLRPLGVALVAVGLAVPVALSDGGGAEIDGRRGFAIWPVDTPSEAKAECLAGEPWRTSAEGTVERFARDVIHVPNPKVSTTEGGFELGGKGIPLYHYGSLREAYGCWYVTSILNREGFQDAGWGYAGTPDERELFLHIGPKLGVDNRAFVSLGSGEHLMQTSDLADHQTGGGVVMTVPADDDEPGHYFIGHSRGPQSEVVDDPDSGTIPAAFDVTDAVEVPGPDASSDLLAAMPTCPRFSRSRDDLRTVRSDISNALFPERPVGKDIHELRNGDFQARVSDSAVVRWVFWDLDPKCRVRGRISTVGIEPRVERVRVSEEAFFFDIDWQGADSADMSLSLGNLVGFSTAPPVKDPIALPIGARRKARPGDGQFVVVFYRGLEVVGIEGGVVPDLLSDTGA